MVERQAWRFRVSGRVQGVGFRWSAVRAATRAGVVGWVMNSADGSVEGYACGDAGALDVFAGWLARGPSSARVKQLHIDVAAVEVLRDFVIRDR